MDENKKRFKILQELEDKGCTIIKDDKGKTIDVCVGTDTDMGTRKAIIFQGDRIKNYDSVSKMLNDLAKQNVPATELQKARSFVSEKFRDARTSGESEEAEAYLPGFGAKSKKSKYKEV